MMLCSHVPISQIPGHMVFLPPLCWHWCLSDSTVSPLTGRKFTQYKKSKYFSTGLLLGFFFFCFGLLYSSGCTSGIYKAQWHTSVSWHMDCSALKLRGVLSRKLSSQTNSLKCETPLLQPKSFNLLVTWATSPWTLSHNKLRSCICVGKADISDIWQRQSYSQIQNLWSYWQRVPMETASVPFKKQTFAMSYYMELRCSSFFSTVRCDFLLTNAECWFSDYSASEITLLFLTLSFLKVQIHPLPCLVLLIPFYSLLEFIPCHYLSQLLESSLGLQEV